MEIINNQNGSMRMKFENSTGTGTIDAYEVFPGIFLSYSNFKLEKCESNYAQDNGMFGFEHCLEGKIEWELKNGDFAFLGPGTLMPYDYERNNGQFVFPMKNYVGFSFGIILSKAQNGLPDGFPVDLVALSANLKSGLTLNLSRNASASFVLGLVYDAQDKDDIHRKLACLELLLFLRDLKWQENRSTPLYMPRAQVMKMKEISSFLMENAYHRFTLEEISKKYNIPVSSLRRGFEGIYGCSVYDFMKHYRVEEAMRRLRETNESITEIATVLGYDNPSKFSAVFKSVVGLSPLTYKNNFFEHNGVV